MLLVAGGDGGLTALQPVDHGRKLLHGLRVPAPGAQDAFVPGPAGQELAVLDELLEQRAVIAVVLGPVADADDLLDRGAPVVQVG